MRSVSDFERGRAFERGRIAAILALPGAEQYPAVAVQLALVPHMEAGAAAEILQRVHRIRQPDTEGTQAP